MVEIISSEGPGCYIFTSMMTLLDLLHVLTTGGAMMLAFLLFSSSGPNRKANRWLSLFLLMLGLTLLDGAFTVMGLYPLFPFLIGYLELPLFIIAPVLYLSVDYYVSINRRAGWMDLLHLLFFAVFTVLSLPFLLSSGRLKLAITEQDLHRAKDTSDYVVLGIIFIQINVYWLLSLLKLIKHRRTVENISASPADIRLDWLLYFVYGIGVVIVTWMVDILWIPQPTINASVAAPIYFLAIFFLGYHVLRQAEIYPYQAQQVDDISLILADSASSTRKQLFTDTLLENLKQKLSALMAEKKPFLNNELSLPELAAAMHLSTHELSHLINEGFGENFYQFINRYRVSESKRLLLSEQNAHLSMVGIAFAAGFNSKTAFNTTFKKMTGLSPSAFKAVGNPHEPEYVEAQTEYPGS